MTSHRRTLSQTVCRTHLCGEFVEPSIAVWPVIWYNDNVVSLGLEMTPAYAWNKGGLPYGEKRERLMTTGRYTFKTLRFDPAGDDQPFYQEYTLNVPEGMTVLEALLRIQAEQDGSLAFRYACRGAVCGSCAMVINGRIDLACRSQVRGLDAETITTASCVPVATACVRPPSATRNIWGQQSLRGQRCPRRPRGGVR